jgi:hypothetical protein
VAFPPNIAAALPVLSGGFTCAYAYNANGDVEFMGRAQPGTAKSAVGWQIQKFVYDVDGNVTDIVWAGSSDRFAFVWTDRNNLSYA